LVHNVGNERKWILVINGHVVECSIVLYGRKFCRILLGHKEERGSIREFLWMNSPVSYVFIKKFVKFLLFGNREWIKLAL